MYARTADAVTEESLRAVFGAFAKDATALKIVPFGLLGHDDPVNGTGSAAPANSAESVIQAADGSSTRPLGWNCCAFLEFASYGEAARAYEAQLDRTRAAAAANDPPQPVAVTDANAEENATEKPEGARRSTPSGSAEADREQELDLMADLEPGELEPGEIRLPAHDGLREQTNHADATSSMPLVAGQDDKQQTALIATDKGRGEALYLVEWSRLGPLRLPPMPRTATLSRHFGVMPPDFHFTSIGL